MGRPPNASRQTRELLATLLADPEHWRHGYGLAQETGLGAGTLYPALIRLAESGLLESRWEQGGADGRPRRLYRLTPAGARAAQEAAARLAADARPTPAPRPRPAGGVA